MTIVLSIALAVVAVYALIERSKRKALEAAAAAQPAVTPKGLGGGGR